MPIFNEQDNNECRMKVNDFYKWAESSYENRKREDQYFEGQLKDVLVKLQDYKIVLAKNTDFEKWSTHDWDLSWEKIRQPDTPVPAWTDQMRNTFSAPIDSLESLEIAIDALYAFRESLGLEESVVMLNERRRRLDVVWFDPEDYSICSTNTRKLAESLTQ